MSDSSWRVILIRRSEDFEVRKSKQTPLWSQDQHLNKGRKEVWPSKVRNICMHNTNGSRSTYRRVFLRITFIGLGSKAASLNCMSLEELKVHALSLWSNGKDWRQHFDRRWNWQWQRKLRYTTQNESMALARQWMHWYLGEAYDKRLWLAQFEASVTETES